jgi:hypothetical protein
VFLSSTRRFRLLLAISLPVALYLTPGKESKHYSERYAVMVSYQVAVDSAYVDRERERADSLAEELRAERSKGFWAQLFGG